MPDGPPKPKKKIGRPSNADKEAAEQAESLQETESLEADAKELSIVAAEMLALPFTIVAGRRGTHWELSETERSQFSLAVSRVVVKYLPGILAKYKAEALLVLVSATIVVPRIRRDMELKAERERSAKLHSDGHPGVGQEHARQVASGAAA